ncbi:hypothetical protein NDA13_003694 [Ustilago tritici]|nr:hypothetical protein NDA13_003694 [Ustilago tritici]
MLSSKHLTQAPRHPSLLSNQSRQEASTIALVSIRRSNPTSGLLLAPTARLTSILFAPALSFYGRAQGSISIHPPKCISAPFPKPRFALCSSKTHLGIKPCTIPIALTFTTASSLHFGVPPSRPFARAYQIGVHKHTARFDTPFLVDRFEVC